MASPVRLQREDDIAVVVIDHPPVNAASAAVRQGLLSAVQALRDDATLQGAVLIGAGRSFIAGSDIREFGQPGAGAGLRCTQEASMTPAPPTRARCCMHRRQLLTLAALALSGVWPAAPALAQATAAYPSKPIRLVVPFPAGGGTDMLARALGEGLAKELGQTVIVDNKAGAGTVIGNDAVAKSPPDGHTLLINTSAFAIAPSLHPRMPYAAEAAFAAVTLLGRAPSVAVVRPDSPLASGAGFLAQARAHPGKLTYGSAGNGTSTHLAAELLKVSHRIFVTHVPYRGASPVITDLMGGQIDVAFATLPSVAPFIASGKLRPPGPGHRHRRHRALEEGGRGAVDQGGLSGDRP